MSKTLLNFNPAILHEDGILTFKSIFLFLFLMCMTVEVTYHYAYVCLFMKLNFSPGGTKRATLDTGATVNVPLFVNNGDLIVVDTRNGQYVKRA